MINVLIPLAGKNTFETNASNAFPKILSDIGGELLIERAAKPFSNLEFAKKIVIAVPQGEVEKYNLNNVLPLLSDSVELCCINGDTQGAACSALLAIENLALDKPLIISSFEQVLDFDLTPYINEFLNSDADAGVLTFEAIHPKWSYVKVDSDGSVTQAAEKNPISKNAIAGTYYFKTAALFVEAAMSMIRKDVKTNNLFFVSPTLNEVILKEGKVKAIPIDKKHYFHISDDHALVSFEEKVVTEQNGYVEEIRQRTRLYVESFNNMDIECIKDFFAEGFSLQDPATILKGKDKAVEYIENIFSDAKTLNFEAKNIFVTKNKQSVIEFMLTVDGKIFLGTDIIQWSDDILMLNMNAYLYERENG